MGYAKEILKTARWNLKNNIVENVKFLYRLINNGELPNFANDEEYTIEWNNAVGRNVFISLDIEDTYFTDETTIKVPIDGIAVAVDGALFVTVENNSVAQFDEISWEELSVEELVAIADALEDKIYPTYFPKEG